MESILHNAGPGAVPSNVTPRRRPTTTPPSPMPAATATPRNAAGSAGGHLLTNKVGFILGGKMILDFRFNFGVGINLDPR